MVNTNSDATVYSNKNAKTKYRVSLRYKSVYVEQIVLTRVQKNAVAHMLFVLSRAMKNDGGCPFFYQIEEIK